MEEDDNSELIKEFLVEGLELVESMDQGIVHLETDPKNTEAVDAVFRVMHSLKGASSFFALKNLELTCHEAENLLGQVQKGNLEINPDIVTLLLVASDKVKEMLDVLAEGGSDDSIDSAEIREKLSVIFTQVKEGTYSYGGASSTPVEAVAEVKEEVIPEVKDEEVVPEVTAQEAPKEDAAKEEAPKEAVSEAPTPPDNVVAMEPKKPAPEKTKKSTPTDSNIRIQVSLIDKLMNLVSELVLTRNQVQQLVADTKDQVLISSAQKLGMITSELQENVMKTRMQPVHNVWAKFPRIVRDLSNNLGKNIKLEMVGQDTELDRSLIESIKDPLTHIIRNAVDHGIEMPEERVANGKSDEGTLLLKAYQQSGQVVIEITDDGKGIAVDKIKQKIIDKGLAKPEQVEKMSNKKVFEYIFHSGFSTAEKVTNISGRGVGMDVVRTNIEGIGGIVDLDSEVGKGSTFKIKIPLTLAIVPSLVVTSSEKYYIIPQNAISSLIRLKANDKSKIEMVQGVPVFRLRGELLPIIYLDEVIKEQRSDDVERSLYVVVLKIENDKFGLVVDKILDHQEIVVKPLGAQLKDINIYAGASISDGDIALILDIVGIFNEFKSTHSTDEITKDDSANNALDEKGEKKMFLLLEDQQEKKIAVPYNDITKLEQIKREEMEYSGGGLVVKYRGKILSLIDLSDVLLDYKDDKSSEEVSIVIFKRDGEEMGLIVYKIVDIVSEYIDEYKNVNQQGLDSLILIRGETTELLSMDKVIETGRKSEKPVKLRLAA